MVGTHGIRSDNQISFVGGTSAGSSNDIVVTSISRGESVCS